MPHERNTSKIKVLPNLPGAGGKERLLSAMQGTQGADMEKIQPAQRGTEEKSERSQARTGLPSERENPETAMRGMRGKRSRDASCGLQRTTGGNVALPRSPLGAPQGQSASHSAKNRKPKSPNGMGDIIAAFAQPVAWALWAASFGRIDYRQCEACKREKARLNQKYPFLFKK